MKIFRKVLFSVAIMFVFVTITSCNKKNNNNEITRVNDSRNLSPYEYTIANISTTDALGRTVRIGDIRNDNYVGLFYHVWHGYHTKDEGIYDITKLLENNSEALYNIDGTEDSPLEKFHYWGEPLYGYYSSDDPWVITRHVELFTMAGIDYLVYDLTNSVIYVDAINALFEVLQRFHDQGFDVPKVAFYTNSHSRITLQRCYDLWYKDGKYSDLWFSFNDKPLIIGVSSELSQAEKELYYNFFDFRESQWPYGFDKDYENGFPWMDWEYPQKNYNGTISVSLAQHPGARMSEGPRSNQGRGFSYDKYLNNSKNVNQGTNYAGQWETVFDNYSDVNNVFVTGFNEWIAIKYSDGQSVFFVDTFNEEYSRDIEMMKGGYGDNYYLQTIDYVKRFTYSNAKHYRYNTNTIDIYDKSLVDWEAVRTKFKDFAGDALSRNYRDAANIGTYIDNSNRNDITDVAITHDNENLYIKVETLDNITEYNGKDLNWMNILIKTKETDKSFAGYNYIINRHPDKNKTSIEKSTGDYNWKDVGKADYQINGNIMQVAIPLKSLGLTPSNVYVQFKVADNVTDYENIMDYYVTGDAAPIGRLNYTYGY